MSKLHSNIEKKYAIEKVFFSHSNPMFKNKTSNPLSSFSFKSHVFMWFMACLFFSLNVYSQKEKKILYEGNNYYHSGKPMEASNIYKNSLKEKQDYYKANFNLGDALYKTADLIKVGKIPTPNKRMTPDSAANIVYDQAADQFEIVAKSVLNMDTAQKAWHNYGNAKLMQKSYEDAILGYKKALKLNPKDEETRYNLAYAQKQLKKQQQNQKNQDDKKNQDKKDSQKPEQKEDKENVNNKNENNKEEAPQPQMNKEQAEQMLNALKNAEKKLQAARKKKGEPGQKVKVEKDW